MRKHLLAGQARAGCGLVWFGETRPGKAWAENSTDPLQSRWIGSVFTGIGLDVPPLKSESGGMNTKAPAKPALPWRIRAKKSALDVAGKQDEEIRKEISEIRWSLSAVRKARSQ